MLNKLQSKSLKTPSRHQLVADSAHAGTNKAGNDALSLKSLIRRTSPFSPLLNRGVSRSKFRTLARVASSSFQTQIYRDKNYFATASTFADIYNYPCPIRIYCSHPCHPALPNPLYTRIWGRKAANQNLIYGWTGSEVGHSRQNRFHNGFHNF